ncbi:MAG: hypothetical protein ABI792_03905 [bacterium]
MKNISIIPAQKKGSQVTFSKVMTSDSDTASREVFIKIKNRLLDINDWHEWGVSSYFCLYSNGVKKSSPDIGDYIRIGLPAPGTAEGDGFDWVIIEALENFIKEDGEYIGLRVRPSKNPDCDSPEIAHFYKDTATSTFIIERDGTNITASYYGRNELPNIKGVRQFTDKLRNIIVAAGGILGFSKIHWKKFIENIVDLNYVSESHE